MIVPLVALLLNQSFAQIPSKISKTRILNPAIEEKFAPKSQEATSNLTNYFKENNCVAILKYFEKMDVLNLVPLDLAIDAYCEPPDKDSEKMFKYAEEKSSDDDTILLLHGRYRWKKYMLTADEIWQKIIQQSKDKRLRELAAQYLHGAGATAESELSTAESSILTAKIGMLRDSNPDGLPSSDPNYERNVSLGLMWGLTVASHSEKEFGFIDWSGNINGTQYETASDSNQINFDISPLFALQGTHAQYFLFRPTITGMTIDGRPFYATAGVSLGEMWQYPDSEFKLLFTTYADRYSQSNITAQQGTHYKIEQLSGFRFESSTVSLGLSWDKTNASQDVYNEEVIPYSNHTGTISFGYQWFLKNLALGFNSSLSIRQDNFDTIYLDLNGNLAMKKRRDTTSNIGPWISWKINNDITGVVYFTRTSVTSTMTDSDFSDHNFKQSIFGFFIKTGI